MVNELGLRPGNLVYNVETLSEVIEVRTDAATIRNHDVTGQQQISNIYYSGLKGVPLNNLWLHNLGAEPMDDEEKTFQLKDLQLNAEDGCWNDASRNLRFKFVHELQNFYADLYKTALTPVK